MLVRKDLYGRAGVDRRGAAPRAVQRTLRKRLQEMFRERFGGSSVDYHLSLGETESRASSSPCTSRTGVQIPEIPYEELEEEVERLARTWDDDLLDSSTAISARARARARARYGPRFPDYYKTTETDWSQVAMDVVSLEQLASDADGFVIGIANENVGERLTRVKLYKTGGKVDLSAFMPLLESLGLRAVEEIPIALHGEGRTYVHDFGVLDARGAVLNLEVEADLVREALARCGGATPRWTR